MPPYHSNTGSTNLYVLSANSSGTGCKISSYLTKVSGKAKRYTIIAKSNAGINFRNKLFFEDFIFSLSSQYSLAAKPSCLYCPTGMTPGIAAHSGKWGLPKVEIAFFYFPNLLNL